MTTTLAGPAGDLGVQGQHGLQSKFGLGLQGETLSQKQTNKEGKMEILFT